MPSLRSSAIKRQIEPSLAEIKEKAEDSAKKSVLKEFAKSDLKSRYNLMMMECPICHRKFNVKIIDDHIRYCEAKAKIIESKKKWEKIATPELNKPKYESPLRKRASVSRKVDFSQIKSRINTGLKT